MLQTQVSGMREPSKNDAETAKTNLQARKFVKETTTFRFCSTCKRYAERSKFSFSKSTCTRCLKKSRERAKVRRHKQPCFRQQDTASQLLLGLSNDVLYCTSCKSTRAINLFHGCRKMCSRCLMRRRLGRRKLPAPGVH